MSDQIGALLFVLFNTGFLLGLSFIAYIQFKEDKRMITRLETRMTNPVINSLGTKRWYNSEGELHREDGPAIEYVSGDKEWYLNGKLHREDGPAIEYSNGTKHWWLNGEQHREDGPAVECADGTKYWYLNGQRHREDGPAIERADGSKYWYLNGKEVRKQDVIKPKPIPVEMSPTSGLLKIVVKQQKGKTNKR